MYFVSQLDKVIEKCGECCQYWCPQPKNTRSKSSHPIFHDNCGLYKSRNCPT